MHFNNSTSHIEEDTLELYSLRRLPEDELPPLEEHLFTCHACQDRLAETDLYIQAVRTATAAPHQRKTNPVRFVSDWFQSLSRPAIGLSFAAALAVFFVVRVPQTLRVTSAEMQSVVLTATRSSMDTHIASTKVPRLQLVGQGLPEARSYQVNVVDNAGKSVWQGEATMKVERIVVTLPSPLSTGRYWVRIYGDSSRGTLLREYALVAD